MSPLWWIPVGAAAFMIGAYVYDIACRSYRASRCWWCGTRHGHPHRRGCHAEPPL